MVDVGRGLVSLFRTLREAGCFHFELLLCQFSKVTGMLLGGRDKVSSFQSMGFLIGASRLSWNVNS